MHRKSVIFDVFSRVGLALCIYYASVGPDANMGRSVCAEEKIEKSVDLFYKQPWTIGLIIGQVTWIYNVYKHELSLGQVEPALRATPTALRLG